MVARKVENKILEMDTRRTNSNNCRENNTLSSNPPQPTSSNHKKWMKEEKKDYYLIVIASILRDIRVVRRNYSTWIVKIKKKMNRDHLKMMK